MTNCSIRGSEDGAHLHSLAEIIAMEPVFRAGSCGNEPSGDRPGGFFLVRMPMFQEIRFAATKPKSTEPDVSAVTVMLSTLHRAVDSTIGKRSAVLRGLWSDVGGGEAGRAP
jgi:hypothetical protein